MSKNKKVTEKKSIYQQLALLGSYWVFPGPPHPNPTPIASATRLSQAIGSAAHRACNTAWICFRSTFIPVPIPNGQPGRLPGESVRGAHSNTWLKPPLISRCCVSLGSVGRGTAASPLAEEDIPACPRPLEPSLMPRPLDFPGG